MPTNSVELGELQLAVMNVLWAQEQATVHEVLACLPVERKPAYTTVLTVLRNLEKRGYVTHVRPEGTRTFHYRPLMSARDTRDGILQDLLQRLFSGSPVLLIKHLLETEGFSLAELRELKRSLLAIEQAIVGKG